MVLLDTNVISELMKTQANPKVQSWLDGFMLHHVFTSSVSKAEIQFGIAILPNGKKKRQLIDSAEKIFDLFDDRILPFDTKSASIYAGIKSERKKTGHPISYADAQIAAITLQHRLQLSTRNIPDFRDIEGLRLTNPWS